jgi:hypothetical protein
VVTGRVLRWSAAVPGIAGAALVVAGVWEVYRPAGLMAGGAFLLLLDWRI